MEQHSHLMAQWGLDKHALRLAQEDIRLLNSELNEVPHSCMCVVDDW